MLIAETISGFLMFYLGCGLLFGSAFIAVGVGLPPGTAVEPARFASESSTELASNRRESPLAVSGDNARYCSGVFPHF